MPIKPQRRKNKMNDLSIKAQKTVESLSSELKELALNIWNNPEIGLEEHTA